MGRYTAEELAQILKAEGDKSITKRTVNYYVFEKKMFEVKESGKKCFTDKDLDKMRGIRLLKECTSFTLDQIKKIISENTLNEIKAVCTSRVLTANVYYGSKKSTKKKSHDFICADKLEEPMESLCLNAESLITSNDSTLDKHISKGSRSIKINEDITLTVSNNININKLAKIIDFIKSLN